MKILLNSQARPYLEGRLPEGAVFVGAMDEAIAAIADAEVAWLDLTRPEKLAPAIEAARNLQWLATSYAGLDRFPLALLRERGVLLTNGAGLHAVPVAEYVVLGMLAAAKGYPDVVRAQDRREWLARPPGNVELEGARVLIIGMGEIGQAIATRLRAFGMQVFGVRSRPSQDMLAPDKWRDRLGEFDWVILAAPLTEATRGMFGAAEISRMKRTARLVNIARGPILDQPALIEALHAGRIGGAVLDVTDPEPAPPGDPVWAAPNTLITMHLSGNSQTRLMERSVALFLENLERYRAGAPLKNAVDLDAGY